MDDLLEAKFGSKQDDECCQEEKTCSQRLLISHLNKWKTLFDVWILVLVLYTSILNLFYATFPAEMSPTIETMNWIVECQFYIDFILNFNTTIMEPVTMLVISDRI